jgi:hypothetical protein
MIPFSFLWDTQKRSILLKWNGFLSWGWERGNAWMRIFGFPIPFNPIEKGVRFRRRRIYLQEALSFLKEWKLKKMEGTISLPDPMMNGVLYGWISALETRRTREKIHVTINFIGQNRFSGEAILPLKSFIHHLKRWVFLLLRERRRRPDKGGQSQWKPKT